MAMIRLNQEEMIAINDKMRDICRTISPEGTPKEERKCEYLDGWTDQKVADYFTNGEGGIQFKCGKDNVGNLRRNVFGALFLQDGSSKNVPPPGLQGMRIKFGQLEAKIEKQASKIEAYMNVAEGGIARLTKALETANHCIDALEDEVGDLKVRVRALEDAVTQPGDDVKTGSYQYKFGGGNGAI